MAMEHNPELLQQEAAITAMLRAFGWIAPDENVVLYDREDDQLIFSVEPAEPLEVLINLNLVDEQDLEHRVNKWLDERLPEIVEKARHGMPATHNTYPWNTISAPVPRINPYAPYIGWEYKDQMPTITCSEAIAPDEALVMGTKDHESHWAQIRF